ncbi:acyl-CoA dehydrogenase family protein [Vineibacter terrae]|uniref:acyl-CoA dehydrogenase family protein n=1 Tax=Vineibacter terrae TaxID=2586908 RepID=UPI0015B53CA2|nr:acyl-CoA dehydrogenase family protein [Vineibacter terrae]
MTLDSLERADTGIDYVARAEALAPKIEALADDIERFRRLPPALLADLHAAGMFRLLLPRSQKGAELDPQTYFRVIETIAKADASVAWCLGQAAGCAMHAAYLDPPVAWKMFGSDPQAVLAWGPGPKVKAVAVEGGYRVTGTWSFASGCRHATWLGAHCPVYEADGTRRRDPDGQPIERTMLVPAGEVAWTDIWNVIGLRGTASDAFSLDDHFVRHDHSVTRDFERECREDGPLFRLSAMAMYELAFSGVALGIARAVLDAFIDMARNKVPRGMRSPIRDNAVVQSNMAQAEVRVRAARLYLLHAYDEIWQALRAGGRFTIDQRITVRMASTHAIHQARDAVDFAYNAAGASAIFDSHPMERRFRDIHTVTQQLQGRLSHFETVGAYILGGDPDLTFV